MRGFREKDVIYLFTTRERKVSSAPKEFFPFQKVQTVQKNLAAITMKSEKKKGSGLSPYVS